MNKPDSNPGPSRPNRSEQKSTGGLVRNLIDRIGRTWSRYVEETWFFPTLLVTPALIFFIIWNLVPVLWLVGLSFYRYALISGKPPEFIGLANFIDIAYSTDIWKTLGNTFTFVLLSVSIETFLGIVFGLFFWGSEDMPGRKLALTLLFTPMILTPVATATFFRLIYNPTFGILNYFIELATGTTIDFLGSRLWAFPAVLAVDIWMWTPFMVLITLAALGSVPESELEATRIDRMPWWKKVRYVILPHGKFILMLGIVLRTIDSFKTTDLIFLMTRGGPGTETEVVGLTLYRKAFNALQMGWSASLALITLLTAIAFTSIFLYVLHLREQQGA